MAPEEIFSLLGESLKNGIFWCPILLCESGYTKLLNTDPIWIRIHNTGYNSTGFSIFFIDYKEV